MSKAKITFKPITSPKGKSLFTFVDKPNTKFDADGVYQASIVLNEEEHADFLNELKQLSEEAFAAETEELKPAAKKKAQMGEPFQEETDEEGNPTGNVIVKAKMKAVYKDKKTGKVSEFKPKVFDAAKQPVDTEGLIIGNGSTIRINFVPRPYYVASSNTAGISLGLRAIQIIDLKAYGGNADNYGFEEEGDGLAPADRGSSGGDEDF